MTAKAGNDESIVKNKGSKRQRRGDDGFARSSNYAARLAAPEIEEIMEKSRFPCGKVTKSRLKPRCEK
jgi:hypothetical protein